MNAVSGPTPSASAAALWTTAAVRPVRAVTSNAQRAATAADTWEPAASRPALPRVTYGRDGRGGGDADGDGDRS